MESNESQEKTTGSLANEKQRRKLFTLRYGFVQYVPGSADNEKNLYGYFQIHKPRSIHPLRLYTNQMIRLAQELHEGYKALAKKDFGYHSYIVNKDNLRIFLELNEYKEKVTLQIKKCFKTDDDPEWHYTNSNVQFDPQVDNPDDLLEFVLSCV